MSPEKGAAEKKKELEKDFRISMEGKAGKEMELMCNLSGYVFEQGVEKEKRKTAERMLRSGRFTCEEIASFTELPKKTVRKIEKKLMVQA